MQGHEGRQAPTGPMAGSTGWRSHIPRPNWSKSAQSIVSANLTDFRVDRNASTRFRDPFLTEGF
jgi:hypothetical protein